MAQDIYAPLEGKRVQITNLSGAFRRCLCGSGEASVSVKPIGLHCGRLVCIRCNATTAWLGRDHMAAMLAAHNADLPKEEGAA